MYNVLVIDDETMISDVLQQALSLYGYNVETASRGSDGLRMFEAGSFDLVITDMRMPDIDGIEVARSIRRSKRPQTPIIAMSGTPWLMSGDAFDFTMSKPFSLDILLDAVKELTVNPLDSDMGLRKEPLGHLQ